MKRKDYLNLIKFFKDYCLKLRKFEPKINYGRDIKFLKETLKKLNVNEIEQIMIYFLKEFKNLKPQINIVFSKKILNEILKRKKENERNFWKKINSVLEEKEKVKIFRFHSLKEILEKGRAKIKV